MKAWHIIEPNEIELKEMESQPLGELCVKIKLLYASVSLTDRLTAFGKIRAEYPIVPGRQAVGMVVEVGDDVKAFARGDIVAIKSAGICSACLKCGEGKYSECENTFIFGLSEDGMLRDFAVLSAADIVKLPDRVQPKDATFIDYIDIAIETLNSLNMEKGQYLVIAGATDLGIILAQAAIYYQIVPILLDNNGAFLEKAAEGGVYYTVDSLQIDTKKKIFSLTGGKMADAVAYMTAGEYPFAQAVELVRKRGSVALCGMEKSRLELSASLTCVLNRKLSVYGISESNKNIASAINMLANKTINVANLFRDEIPFESVGEDLKSEITSDLIYYKTIVKMP